MSGRLAALTKNLPDGAFNKERFSPIIDYFPDSPKASELLMTRDTVRMASSYSAMKKLIDLLVKEFHDISEFTITDATAGVGSSSLALAAVCKKVHAVEINRKTFKLLRNNVSLYDTSEKINLIRGDYLDHYKTLHQDIIFMDATWSENLAISGVPIPHIANDIFSSATRKVKKYSDKQKTKLLVVKAPKDFCVEKLGDMPSTVDRITVHRIKPFTLIFIFPVLTV